MGKPTDTILQGQETATMNYADTRFISTTEFANRMGLTLLFVRGLCRQNMISCLKVGPKKYAIDWKRAQIDLDRLMDEHMIIRSTTGLKKRSSELQPLDGKKRKRGRPRKLPVADMDEKKLLLLESVNGQKAG